jgi:hypothetical protein
MSDFLGQLNGLYGRYYRKVEGGKRRRIRKNAGKVCTFARTAPSFRRPGGLFLKKPPPWTRETSTKTFYCSSSILNLRLSTDPL